MTERFRAKQARSQAVRFHTQTAGVSLTAQQPRNNIARVAIQALAAVLGGTQSLHTDAFDEALALPTEEAARIALRTQQILAYESGVAQTVDPLGGSYFVESLTMEMEQGAFDYFDKLDAMGGMVRAIELGYPQKEIAEVQLSICSAPSRPKKKSSSASMILSSKKRRSGNSLHRRKRTRVADRQAEAPARAAFPGEVTRPLRAAPRRRARTAGGKRKDLRRQHHAGYSGLRPRLCHCWRNLRGAARCLWHL